MGKRPRIKKNNIFATVITDGEGFIANSCSSHAKLIEELDVSLVVELWLDIHCQGRQQIGDENGKRDGIEPAVLQDLVQRSLKHILHFQLEKNIRLMRFVNDINVGIPRFIIRERQPDGIMLNLVVEYHFDSLGRFEVTMVTAMKVNGFRIIDSQYIVELQGNTATLSRMVNKNEVLI